MIHLNLDELEKIKRICKETDIQYFTLEEENKSGIGSILMLSYDTMIANYPANIRVEVRGVENW
jgi:hypothetical protein